MIFIRTAFFPWIHGLRFFHFYKLCNTISSTCGQVTVIYLHWIDCFLNVFLWISILQFMCYSRSLMRYFLLQSVTTLLTYNCWRLVTGLIWSEVKQLWDVGLEEYVADMWNVIDFITNSLYVATVSYTHLDVYKRQSQ